MANPKPARHRPMAVQLHPVEHSPSPVRHASGESLICRFTVILNLNVEPALYRFKNFSSTESGSGMFCFLNKLLAIWIHP